VVLGLLEIDEPLHHHRLFVVETQLEGSACVLFVGSLAAFHSVQTRNSKGQGGEGLFGLFSEGVEGEEVEVSDEVEVIHLHAEFEIFFSFCEVS
jgi:hypothetical protein